MNRYGGDIGIGYLCLEKPLLPSSFLLKKGPSTVECLRRWWGETRGDVTIEKKGPLWDFILEWYDASTSKEMAIYLSDT